MKSASKSDTKSGVLAHNAGAAQLAGDVEAAGFVAWTYDLIRAQFDFQGKLEGSDLSDLNALFAADALSSLTSGMQQGKAVRCFLTTEANRVLYFKGNKRHDQPLISGLVTDVTDDLPAHMHAMQGLKVPSEHIDPLTGLYNRYGFLKAAQTILQQSGEFDLVVGDLNRFRRLNEALGHERADLVLGLLARRLREVFDDKALLARLGEDEFAVLTLRGFPRVSERMRTALERSITVAGFDIHPTFSMGAVSVDGGEHALEAGELLRRAEMAVEVAQAKGVGSVASYKHDLETDGLTQLALEAELRKAFVSGEIIAHYQPIIDLGSGRIAGFEALARWAHPKRGLIRPDHFLGLTRDMGLLCDLTNIILSHSVKNLAKWRAAYDLPDSFFISVNLSAADIERAHLVEDISRLIRSHALPVKALKLEVTESDVMRDPHAAARVLGSLREAGAGIALDDFGTGFSSLSYLARLPLDTLKIDRSFVSTMITERASEKIVRSVLTLGRDFGLEVVAEGVEDMVLAENLAQLGCHFGQGWGFAKALKEGEAESYMLGSLKQTPDGALSV
ncbi:putative bifunctional diguanylate cyclase/phosphodiesterase [Asticcacaulis tiandongensis]|uniref:putative bifunctional diguanylate cyclase/phosphodiesterase n=1 Tax=Asticcacaulis tiandongensis TaxID=2565365 RepID=UPI001128988F|nr:bifunctional diguanylate cyclase/phosphodiesterase [Asticcacaulis tiandongensis]